MMDDDPWANAPSTPRLKADSPQSSPSKSAGQSNDNDSPATENDAGPSTSTSPLASGSPTQAKGQLIESSANIDSEHQTASQEIANDDFDDFDDFDAPGAGSAVVADEDGFGDFGDFEEGEEAKGSFEDVQAAPTASEAPSSHARFVSHSYTPDAPGGLRQYRLLWLVPLLNDDCRLFRWELRF